MISIIVPVYNAEEYLEKCLESLIHQTYTNIEIILINDGSRDHSLEICQKYAQEDKRIVVVSQENQGVSVARNNGLEHVLGDFICFVDADDYLDEDFCEKMLKKLQDTQVDVVMCSHRNVVYETQKYHKRSVGKRVVKKDIINLLFDPEFDVVLWAKLFRRNVFDGLRFPDGLIHEDTYLFVDILKQCVSFAFFPEVLYNHIIHESSIMTTINKNRLDEITAYEHWLSFFQNDPLYPKALKKTLEAIIYTYSLLYPILDKTEKKDILKKFKMYFIECKRNLSYKEKMKAYFFILAPNFFVLIRNRIR